MRVKHHDPYSNSKHEWLSDEPDPRTQPILLSTKFNGEYLHRWTGVIVERWDHVVPVSSRSGSKNRKYKQEFTELERKKLGTWHNRFYGWEMRTGMPDWVELTMEEFRLLQRAGEFFASV